MDKKFVEKAKNELREDESRKEQSLKQFRERIEKHPFLSNCRQGEKDNGKSIRDSLVL